MAPLLARCWALGSTLQDGRWAATNAVPGQIRATFGVRATLSDCFFFNDEEAEEEEEEEEGFSEPLEAVGVRGVLVPDELLPADVVGV